ncbi:hypothetical protein ACFXPS_05545 [Nocardia sp. NPDC059091]|uniref:hypothetical protein n=1 Tax=unclassified Nocardia TaxID=2637762 RepID=UPI0036AE428D
MADYNNVVSLSREEFERLGPSVAELRDQTKFTKSDDEDIAKMERLLDLREGVLANDEYYLERVISRCGRILTMYDFVFTALVDAGHSKSLIVHTFIGNKLVVNEPRLIRCSVCAEKCPSPVWYRMPQSYGCRPLE